MDGEFELLEEVGFDGLAGAFVVDTVFLYMLEEQPVWFVE